MPLQVVKAEQSANDILQTAWSECDVATVVSELWVGERTARRWREPISPTESGVMNPLGRANLLVEATQKQSEQGALVMLSWLIINFIRRSLPTGAGNAQVIWRLETVFSELRLKVVCALSEEEAKSGTVKG